jgi:methyl-accepting chemotaxis protein
MKLKFRISLIVIAIVVVILVSMSVVQMRMVSEMSISSAKKQMQYLVGSRAEYWKGRFNGYLETIRAVADIMANYDTIPVDARRDRYDDMLYAAFTARPDFIRIYSIWKPNALGYRQQQYRARWFFPHRSVRDDLGQGYRSGHSHTQPEY